jgi:hypothetical protein
MKDRDQSTAFIDTPHLLSTTSHRRTFVIQPAYEITEPVINVDKRNGRQYQAKGLEALQISNQQRKEKFK